MDLALKPKLQVIFGWGVGVEDGTWDSLLVDGRGVSMEGISMRNAQLSETLP